MKILYLLLMSLSVCSIAYAQKTENKFFENNQNLGGDVTIKAANYTEKYNNILLSNRNIFEIENESLEFVNVSVNRQNIVLNIIYDKASKADVKIFNVFGGLEQEANYNVSKGRNSITISTSSLNKRNIYFVQIQIEGKTISQKINLQ